jgi:tetratricopeptide (TPR) repeat protein
VRDAVTPAAPVRQAGASALLPQGADWVDMGTYQFVPPATPEGVHARFWNQIYRMERKRAAYGLGGDGLVDGIQRDLARLSRQEQFDAMLRFLRMTFHYRRREDPKSQVQDRVFHNDRFMEEVRDFAGMARRAADGKKSDTYLRLFASVRALASAGPEGLRLSKELAEIAPDNSAVLSQLAQDLFDGGDLSSAIEASRRAILLQPQGSGAYTTMASAKYQLNDYEGAYRAASAAVKTDPSDRVAANILQLTRDRVPMPAVLSASQDSHERIGRRMIFYILCTMVGGFLVALALLHTVAGLGARRDTASSPLRDSTRPSDAPPPLVGGSYRVSHRIGTGGMGHVLEAQDVRLDRRVAIKQMREEISSNPKERARFLQEARTVASLKHPNIVEIHSVVTEGSEVYLVFEYVDGHTVSQYLDHYRRLAFGHALWILQGVGAALEYAHLRGIIHRDLKPSNIMITRDKSVKVMDFGVARQAKDTLQTLSMAEAASGTPPFMAPEQDHGQVCKQSDVYAMAVCFYQMLTGELPFRGASAALALAKMSGSYTPASRIVDGLPAGVDEVIAWGLDPDPARRCPNPAKFVYSLQSLIGVNGQKGL